jgi:hypothetical protein
MERPGYINAATLLSKINDDCAKPSISNAYCPQPAQRSFCQINICLALMPEFVGYLIRLECDN